MDVTDELESPHKGQRGLRRIFKALSYSLSGLRLAYDHESAFRQEILIALVLIPFACFVPVSAAERVLLIASGVLVLIVELLNSSVEAAIDRIGLDTHRLSKRAKDLGSAAVFLALLLLGVAWGVIVGPRAVDVLRTAAWSCPYRVRASYCVPRQLPPLEGLSPGKRLLMMGASREWAIVFPDYLATYVRAGAPEGASLGGDEQPIQAKLRFRAADSNRHPTDRASETYLEGCG
jgi:diacylglycerol kinase (ATP)